MSKSEKLLEKIRNNPKAAPFDDLDKMLRGRGFVRRQPQSGSSHYYYTYGVLTLSVPYKRPYIGEIYVKQALALIEQAAEGEV
jgi:hypothetical protein